MAQKKTVVIASAEGLELAQIAAYRGPDQIGVKRIGWKRLAEAERAIVKTSIKHMQEIGGPKAAKELQQAIKEAGDSREVLEEKVREDKKADPLSDVDLNTLLTYGMATVTYGDQTRVATMDDIDDLETSVARAVGLEVLRLSEPSLFETEDVRKNA